MKASIKCMVATVLVAVCAASSASQRELPKAWTQLTGVFDDKLTEDHNVGGSIALVEQGRIVSRRDFGFADRASGRRVDADTLFHWASNTKTINAITVMQLRDRGLLTLNDPLTRHVPELRRMHNSFGSMDDITIRMALTHTAGFQGPTWPYRTDDAWQPFEPTSWEQLVAMMPYQKIEFAPGSQFGYSNPSWIYLARTLEHLTGDPWEYYVQKNVFTPLGMTRSYFNTTPPHLASHRSHRYHVAKDAAGKYSVDDLSGEFNPGITIPNGGWNAPLTDVATYIGFLTGASGGDAQLQQRYDSVLKRSTLEEMWQPQSASADMVKGTDSVGLGFFVSKRGQQRVIGHTGSQGGFLSFFFFDPASGRGVVGAINTSHGPSIDHDEVSAFQKVMALALQVFD
ncbi:serine hydrolase domain-containing protein [Peristeroidobacter soli]|uniref:serine hydrolase domain-containing protein n=1 Tax=Peristeroidobacter soli TaxID=2497877 RepID=UPI00101D5B21|nr:serine hydrolase domain-containing protein [Peristeroidobacter soli]